MSKDKIFADGFKFKMPRESAPDWVVGEVSVKVDQAISFLKTHAKQDGFVNLKVNISGSSNQPYMQLDDFVPDSSKRKETTPQPQAVEEEEGIDDLPF